MRFLIRELPYEKLAAAGRLQYEQDGRPTGALESWRLTTAPDGYRFLRLDLDARAAASGQTTLYHLTLNPEGRAERLAFRSWGDGREAQGNVLLEERQVTLAVNRQEGRQEMEITLPASYAFWFPSTTGLGLLAPYAEQNDAVLAAALDKTLTLYQTEVRFTWGGSETLTITGESRPTRSLTICWRDQERTIWVDEYGRPLKMQRDDGLMALETRYIRHRV